MAKRKAGKAIPAAKMSQTESPAEGQGLAYTLGWGLFLAFVALTPLVMGGLPSQVGALAVFHANDTVSLPKAVAILVLSGLSLTALCVSVFRGESELRWHPVMWIMVALFGWAVVSTVVSASPARSVLGSYASNDGLVAAFGYLLVVFLAIQYVRSTRALRTLALTAVVSGSLVAAYAVLQSQGMDVLVYVGPMDRMISTFGNPDMLGNYLVFPFALALGLALSAPSRWSSLRWWAAVALLVSALFLSGTRGAWLGAAAVVLSVGFASWYGAEQTSRRLNPMLAGLALGAIGASFLAIVLALPRASSASAMSSLLTRISNGRDVIWLTGLRGWLAHPITGWGPDAFGNAFQSAVGRDWFAMVEGLQVADSAHNFLVQVLVTLGIVGLALTAWVLVQTGILSLRSLKSARGPARWLLVASWAALVGMTVALLFGVTLPGVSVWLWLTVGLLLAPISRPIPGLMPAPLKALLVAGMVLGVALAVWAGSWMGADVASGWAMQQPTGPSKVAALQTATRLNPLSPDYRWQVAEALVDLSLAEQSAGESGAIVEATMSRGIAAFTTAAEADRGDAMVRVALSNTLLRYSVARPESDAAQRAVQVALEAVALAPRNPAALGALAFAYRAIGRRAEAEAAARLARSIAPEYSNQTLGSLGLTGAEAP